MTKIEEREVSGTQPKRPYEAPRLETYGDVATVTRLNNTATGMQDAPPAMTKT